MEEKPVGWMGYEDGKFILALHTEKQVRRFLEATNETAQAIPVYTHQMRQLTDEQILDVLKENYGDNIHPTVVKNALDFARAILKRAQER